MATGIVRNSQSLRSAISLFPIRRLANAIIFMRDRVCTGIILRGDHSEFEQQKNALEAMKRQDKTVEGHLLPIHCQQIVSVSRTSLAEPVRLTTLVLGTRDNNKTSTANSLNEVREPLPTKNKLPRSLRDASK